MSASTTTVKEYFDTLSTRFKAEASKGVKACYQFELSGDGGGTYHVQVQDGSLTVLEGAHDSPNVTITMTADNYLQMAQGKLNGQMAYVSGKLKVSGDLGLAMKMQSMFPPDKN